MQLLTGYLLKPHWPAITIDAAKILGIEQQVGSIAVGKDADLVLFSGDPFEYTTQVRQVIINGQLVSDE